VLKFGLDVCEDLRKEVREPSLDILSAEVEVQFMKGYITENSSGRKRT
jgi:hypothetical protein